MDIVINYYAVVVAAVVCFVISWAWYSPFLFAKAWMKEIGMNMEGAKPTMAMMWPPMLAAFIAQLVFAYVLAHFGAAYGAVETQGALMLGFWVWLGFIATTVLNPVLWEKRSLTWYAIVAGHLLVTTEVAALILVLWP